MLKKSCLRKKVNMKTNRKQQLKKSQSKDIKLYKYFDKKKIKQLSRETGFSERDGKMQVCHFIEGFFRMALRGLNTYSQWAQWIGILNRKPVSKQAVWERITSEAAAFIKSLLQDKLSQTYNKLNKSKDKLFFVFKHVYLQDSTTIKLPDALSKDFPGTTIKGKKKATARINTIYDLCNSIFIHFGLWSFTKNDQSLSDTILAYLQEGDLVIRDLGFFVIAILKKITSKGAYFLTRKPYGVNVYDIKTGKRLILKKLLGRKKYIDMNVIAGDKCRIECRIIAIRLPEKLAEERRRKARKDRDRRLNHSTEYYDLLGYAIFLTNVSQSVWTFQQIQEIYRLRWQIEIIFKSWKSCFHIEKLIHAQCKNKARIEFIIYAMLLYISLFHVKFYNYFKNTIYRKTGRSLSLLKFALFMACHFETISIMNESTKWIEKYLIKYCLYESRKDRVNAMERYNKLAA